MKGSLANPLGFQKYRKCTFKGVHFEVIPLMIVISIAGLIAMLDRTLFLQPGVCINIPKITSEDSNYTIPIAVLTFKANETLILEGHLYTMHTISAALYRHVQTSPTQDPTLLLKVDQGAPVKSTLAICAMAKRAGFTKVQIAATQQAFIENNWMYGL